MINEIERNETWSANQGGANGRWMLVDDNADYLDLMAAAVSLFTGATIECYSSPASALAAFAAAPDDYELVITDLEMPGMTGSELCRRLRALVPSQKVFLATGSGFFNEWTARKAGFSALLRKPFPLAAVEQALAAAGLVSEICLA